MIDNPAALLVDVSGNFMAVTSSTQIRNMQPALISAGVGSDGVVRFSNIDSNFALKSTGSFNVTNSQLNVTGSVALSGTGSVGVTSLPNITGSVNITNNFLNVTGSVGITNGITVISQPSVTGTVALTGTGSVIVASIPNVTGAVNITNSQLNVTGSIGVANGLTIISQPAITGTVALTGTGSIIVTSLPNVTGSVNITNATFTNGTQKTQITDGANSAAVKTTTPTVSDAGLIVRPIDYEPATFNVIASATALSNNKSMISIVNTDASVLIKLHRIFIVNTATSAVTGVVTTFEFRRITGHSVGTLLTAETMDSTDTLNANVTVRSGATVSGESTTLINRVLWSSDEWGTGTLDEEGYDHGIQALRPFWQKQPGEKGLILRQNQGVTIKCATNTTAGTFDIYMVFTQE